MRFLSVRDLRNKSAEVWKKLSKNNDLVITSNGKPIAILSKTSEETLEESLDAIRRARAIAAVESIQARSIETGRDRMAVGEINKEIKAVRKKRSK